MSHPSYRRPETLADALALQREHDFMIMAGGTDIYPAHVVKSSWGSNKAPAMLDITAIPELRGISKVDGGWRIGATTRWSDLAKADLPPLFDGLKTAAREVGGLQIQNRGTLAGNICTASPAGDGLPNLYALNARVEISSASTRHEVPIEFFLKGYREVDLRTGEMVTAILVPEPYGRTVSAFRKLGARKYLVISIVMVGGVLVHDGERVTDARIAVGACSAMPARQERIERALKGRALADLGHFSCRPDDVTGLAPIDDVRASSAFRMDAAMDAINDVFRDLAARTGPPADA